MGLEQSFFSAMDLGALGSLEEADSSGSPQESKQSDIVSRTSQGSLGSNAQVAVAAGDITEDTKGVGTEIPSASAQDTASCSVATSSIVAGENTPGAIAA